MTQRASRNGSNGGEALLQVRRLRTNFETEDGVVEAVCGCSFDIARGERVAIVGESGSGKSVTALSIMQLVAQPAGRILEGSEIWFKGKDLTKMSRHDLERIRGAEIGMVFQDPLSALNPVHTIGRQIEEAILLHRKLPKAELRRRAVALLAQMGLPRPDVTVDAYPHELSGGMRQRAMIAMAISCEPDLLIADEPTTALDVTIQAQIMELLLRLSHERGIAVLLITHDLGLAAGFADRILVMYGARIVESGTTDEIFYDPKHPYSLALMKSIARIDQDVQERLFSIRGSPPRHKLPGCPFHPRCDFSDGNLCIRVEPELNECVGSHRAACHYAGRLKLLPGSETSIRTQPKSAAVEP